MMLAPHAERLIGTLLPTGFECGVLNGKVAPGSTVAIVGAGPIGLAALLTAQFYSPAEVIMIDLDDNRLEVARRFGATQTINSGDGKATEKVNALTARGGCRDRGGGRTGNLPPLPGLGSPGGVLANVGVHGTKASKGLDD